MVTSNSFKGEIYNNFIQKLFQNNNNFEKKIRVSSDYGEGYQEFDTKNKISYIYLHVSGMHRSIFSSTHCDINIQTRVVIENAKSEQLA